MKKLIWFVIIIMSLSFVCGCGKGKEEKETISTHTPSQYDSENVAEETGWLKLAAENYIKKEINTDFKLFIEMKDAGLNPTEENILTQASANIFMYLDSKTVEKQEIADFSDNFARYLAKNGSTGNVNFTVYILPSNLYDNVNEGNYTQTNEDAKGNNDCKQYGFKFGAYEN